LPADTVECSALGWIQSPEEMAEEGKVFKVLVIGFVIGTLVYGAIQVWAAYLGIALHWGAGWAIGILIFAVTCRLAIAISVGAFFGAWHAWGWPWWAAVLFAAPGLAFMFLTLPVFFFEKKSGR
jgi:hypothetical protein